MKSLVTVIIPEEKAKKIEAILQQVGFTGPDTLANYLAALMDGYANEQRIRQVMEKRMEKPLKNE